MSDPILTVPTSTTPISLAQILMVDDDPNLLSAMQRALRKEFQITTARSGQEGIDLLKSTNFSVVVSDFRMPGMDGVAFLTAARKLQPHATRMLLTGYADLATAIKAVNEGQIFRLLTKPISTDDMQQALLNGVEQNRLVTAERELLSKTLLGSISVLFELLTRSSSAAVNRSMRLQLLVNRMAAYLQLTDLWQYEVAAMLSQVGYLLAPKDLLRKFYAGRELSHSEQEQLGDFLLTGRDLLMQIPRLETVAEMIGRQRWTFSLHAFSTDIAQRDTVNLGAQMMQTANEYETRLARGETHEQAIQKMLFAATLDSRLVQILDKVARK
jgi:response regulator RpfG family c-di-GMP phosphodiesterase